MDKYRTQGPLAAGGVSRQCSNKDKYLLGDLAIGRCGDTAQYGSCHAVRRQVQLKTGHLASKIRVRAPIDPGALSNCASDVSCNL